MAFSSAPRAATDKRPSRIRPSTYLTSIASGTRIQVAFAAKASEHSRILGIFGHRRRAFRSVGEVECRTVRRGLEGGLVCGQKTGPSPRGDIVRDAVAETVLHNTGQHYIKAHVFHRSILSYVQELRFDGVHPRSASEWDCPYLSSRIPALDQGIQTRLSPGRIAKVYWCPVSR
jgi:hypothetical protein